MLFHYVFGTLLKDLSQESSIDWEIYWRRSDSPERLRLYQCPPMVTEQPRWEVPTPAPVCAPAMTAVISLNIHCQHYFYCVITKVHRSEPECTTSDQWVIDTLLLRWYSQLNAFHFHCFHFSWFLFSRGSDLLFHFFPS